MSNNVAGQSLVTISPSQPPRPGTGIGYGSMGAIFLHSLCLSANFAFMVSHPAQILARSKGPKSKYAKSTVTNAAKQLGSLGGQIGGPARAEALSPGELRDIAIHAANMRWDNPCNCRYCKR